MSDDDEDLSLPRFEFGGLGTLIETMTELQAKSYLQSLNDEDLRLIHSFTHVLGEQMFHISEIAKIMGCQPEDPEAPATEATAMVAFFGAWTQACCTHIAGHLADTEGGAFIKQMTIATSDVLGVQREAGGEIEWTNPAAFIEGPVPDLPKEE